jgi:hypothetical protein
MSKRDTIRVIKPLLIVAINNKIMELNRKPDLAQNDPKFMDELSAFGAEKLGVIEEYGNYLAAMQLVTDTRETLLGAMRAELKVEFGVGLHYLTNPNRAEFLETKFPGLREERDALEKLKSTLDLRLEMLMNAEGLDGLAELLGAFEKYGLDFSETLGIMDKPI